MYESIKSSDLAADAVVSVRSRTIYGRRVSQSLVKKTIDVVVALMALLFLSPALLVIALLIKLDSAGPVFFRQRRTGLNSKPFYIYKFRTMTVAEDGDKVIQASQNDQRVTRIGKILRRTSIDEIPQLINIVKGDMSLVGPRPHALSHDTEFAPVITYYSDRFFARPGLTGLAQVRGYRGEILTKEDLEKRIESDIEYIEKWTIELDLLTIARTVPCLFGHKKAY